jgi:hypothetical protein
MLTLRYGETRQYAVDISAQLYRRRLNRRLHTTAIKMSMDLSSGGMVT